MVTPQALLPALLIPLVLLRLYWRFRSHFGRQPIQRKRTMVRIGIMSLLLALFLFSSLHRTELLASAIVGVVIGAALAVFGLRLTKFEITPGGEEFYTPNSYIGMALMVVLVGRLIYRFVTLAPMMESGAANGLTAASTSPFTVGVITVLLGYYLVYFIGILREGRKHGVA